MTTKRVDLWYPRTDAEGSVQEIVVELTDVRAADALHITYDFDRDGYRIGMDQTRFEIFEEGDRLTTLKENVEVAFIPAWNEVAEWEI